MLIWQAEPISGIWIPTVRIGDIGGTLGGSVGANLLGFIGGFISSSGRYILGLGYGGSFHLWANNQDSDRWYPKPFPTGHFGAVSDLSWANDGSYLVTASADQTCRVHARVIKDWIPCDMLEDSASVTTSVVVNDTDFFTWREVSRPQVNNSKFKILSCLSLLFHILF